MRKDDDFSLSTHSLRTVVYIRKEVLYGIVKKSVKIRKLFLYAFFTGSLGIRKFEISCCESECMTEIRGKSILVRVSARSELARVRVTGSRLYVQFKF